MRQHDALERMLDQVEHAAAEVDPRALQKIWNAFERALVRHLDLEEESLFPLVESVHPEEARERRAEHARIRQIVGELGLSCDLHAVRREAVEDLVSTLRAHAAREDRTLYRWVDEHVPVDTRRHLLRLFVDTVRAEMHPDSPLHDRR
jgi:hemerythrin